MNQKIKLTSDIWANLEYGLANIILQNCFTNENLNKTQEIGKTIYHYTSLQSFLAIVQSQSFFCTNHNYLNDKKEYKFGVEQVIKVIGNLKIENLFDEILNNFEDEIDTFYENERYVTCFSKEGDLLSQWRAYANQGKGIAIGFDLYNLEDSIHQHVTGRQILYDEQYQLTTIKEIIKLTIDYYNNIKKSYDWSEYGYERLVKKSIINSLHHVISAFKSEGFKEEKEFRIEYCIDGNMIKKSDQEINFRATNDMIIPYVVLESDYKNHLKRKKTHECDVDHTFIIKRLPIKEIVIGPSLDFEVIKTVITGLLNKLGYVNVIIKKSKIPYRI